MTLGQMAATPGDIAGNARRIVESVQAAKASGAQLWIAPELALLGYNVRDLLLRQGMSAAIKQGLQTIQNQVTGITLVMGYPEFAEDGIYNAVAVLRDGQWLANYRKQVLDDQGAFQESRYYRAGQGACIFTLHGHRLGILLGSELSQTALLEQAARAGAELLLVPDRTIFIQNRSQVLEPQVADQARSHGLAIAYCNAVGGYDALVFAGGSFAVSADGELAMRAPALKQGDFKLAWDHDGMHGAVAEPASSQARLYAAVVMALRDYVQAIGFPGVLIGASGGIDSALTMAIAADALGGDRVWAVSLPSRYTAGISNSDAAEQARRLGVHYDEISIESSFSALLDTLKPHFAGKPADTTEENLQARVRGDLLMSLSNKFGHVVLVPSNKSEIAVGYTTLYGDMCGGFAPLKDIYKTQVYELARYRNQQSPAIPERVLERAPSAELRNDQADNDSLPPYDVLDPIVAAYVEEGASLAQIRARGFAAADVEQAARLIQRAEYKRQQMPPGPAVTVGAFDSLRHYPIVATHGQL